MTPQALAWHGNALWMGLRDPRRVYGIDVETWAVFEETAAPGIPWAAVSAVDVLRFKIGETFHQSPGSQEPTCGSAERKNQPSFVEKGPEV